MKKQIFCILIIGIITLQQAAGFSLEPITADFTPSGQGAMRTFRIRNNTTETIAVRISMLTRSMDEHGNETNNRADDDFVVYPSSIVVGPNTVQAVRVQWRGEANPQKELSYRILAEQIPVDFSEDQTRSTGNIRIMFRYLGAVYIVPEGARHQIEVSEMHKDDQNRLVLTVKNSGTAHVIMNDLTVTLRKKESKEIVARFNPEDLTGINGENILAGIKRVFYVSLPDMELPTGIENMEAILNYEALR